MTIAQKYQKSKDGCLSLRFKTTHPDGDAYDGIVVGIKRRLIVLQEERDFELDGLMVFPKRVIKGYRDGGFERCCNKILRDNGQINRLRSPSWLALCNSIPQVLEELKHRDIWPAVETVFNDGKDSALYLGSIEYIEKDSFELLCYSSDGEWEGLYELDYDEIFGIGFNSKYCNYWNAFMKAKDEESTFHAEQLH